jgi:hypothetical protein
MFRLKDHTSDFLTRLDNYWRIRYPLLFASRIVHVVCYGVLFLALTLSVLSLTPIQVFRIPDTSWLLMGYFIIVIFALVIYIYYQRLLDIVYYHGRGNLFYSLKAIALFFAVFLLTSQLIALPYVYVNYRIYKTFTETRLPPSRIYLPSTNLFNPQVDTLPFINSTCSVTDTSLVQYYGLPAKAQEDVVFSLGRNIFYNFSNFRFGRDSIGAWAHYLIPKAKQAPADSLLVYYRSLNGIDSFHSDIFNCTIYSGRIHGRISYSGATMPRDTSIGRYYFYSTLSHKIVSSDSNDIQLRLLTEQILQHDELKEDTTPVNRLATVRNMEGEYLFACLEWVRWKHILYSAAFYGCMAAMLALFICTLIRFFGVELFLVSLGIPLIFLCTLAFRNTFRDALSESYTNILWGLLFLLALLPFLRRRRFGEIIGMQLIFYAIFVILLRFPYDMYHFVYTTEIRIAGSRIGINTPLKWLIIPIPGAMVLSAVLFDKLCRLYVKPEG